MRPSVFRQSMIDSVILRFIIENGYHPDKKPELPTIQEISQQMGISVAKARESLEVARVLGIVDVKPGRGMIVQKLDFSKMVTLGALYAISQDENKFAQLGQMRNALEIYFWDTAVALLTEEDIKELRRLVGAAVGKIEAKMPQVPAAEHRSFHLTIFSRLKNPFVQGVLESFWEAYEAFGLNLYMELDYHRDVWKYHADIVDAIEAGEIERSKELLIKHMELLKSRTAGMPG